MATFDKRLEFVCQKQKYYYQAIKAKCTLRILSKQLNIVT